MVSHNCIFKLIAERVQKYYQDKLFLLPDGQVILVCDRPMLFCNNDWLVDQVSFFDKDATCKDN